jgi:hypothetical protein
MMTRTSGKGWFLPAGVFSLVVAAQLYLVARMGTDIPYQDQWDIEGRWLYPAWREGNLRMIDLVQPFNEHRILWTNLLNLGLFSANGQWDPLVQLVALALLRGACAAGLAWQIGKRGSWSGQVATGAGITLAFLPHIAWNSVLWGIVSHNYFQLGFSMLALAWLGDAERSRLRLAAGIAAGVAALFAMAAGAFVPVALLGLAGLRAVERGRFDRAWVREAWPALALLGMAWLLRVRVPAHAALQATSMGQFFNTLGRALAWPHTWMPAAAVVLNLPLLIGVSQRLMGRRTAAAGEDFVLLIGAWAMVAAGAMAWTRGGGHEFDTGVPSRYVDFLVLLPIANVWYAARLAWESGDRWHRVASVLAGAWVVFLFIGWLGLSAQLMRGFILPRMRDRDAPVRLAVAFQRSGDAAVFAGQPAFYVPHPNLGSVRAVLHDPRMKGALPPSFQPEEPLGPLSRAVRLLLDRRGYP